MSKDQCYPSNLLKRVTFVQSLQSLDKRCIVKLRDSLHDGVEVLGAHASLWI